MFTLPVVYEKHQVGIHINSSQLRFGKNIAQLLKTLCFQAQIDQYVGLIRTQVNSVVGK